MPRSTICDTFEVSLHPEKDADIKEGLDVEQERRRKAGDNRVKASYSGIARDALRLLLCLEK